MAIDALTCGKRILAVTHDGEKHECRLSTDGKFYEFQSPGPLTGREWTNYVNRNGGGCRDYHFLLEE